MRAMTASGIGMAGASRAWMSTMNRTHSSAIEQHRAVSVRLCCFDDGRDFVRESTVSARTRRAGAFVDIAAAATTCTHVRQHVIGTLSP